MGLMKEIHIELHNASNLIKWMENRIEKLEEENRRIFGERRMDYKEELIKFIKYVLDAELPYEKCWVYAVKLQERMEKK